MQTLRKRKPFYFVNRSETSDHLSNSQPHEKAAVQRYVQTGRKRSRNAKHPKPKTERQEHNPSSTPTAPSNAQTLQSLAKGASPDTAETMESLCYQSILCKRDPFDAASVLLDNTVADLLHYYMYYYHPSQWQNELALLRHGVYIHHDAVLSLMRTAIADQLVMYCILSASACRLQFVDRLPSALLAGTESCYIHKALQLLASHISTTNTQDDDQLRFCLTCMMFLNSAEGYRGNLSAARAHLDGARQLLEPMGGLATVQDETLKGQLAMADLFLSCVSLKPCSFDCSYDPDDASLLGLSSEEMHSPSAMPEARGLLNRPESFIPSELRGLVEQLTESHDVKNHVSTLSMSSKRVTQVTHWITLRHMAIRNRLLALEITDPRTHCVRVGIIMWTLLMNMTGRAKTLRLMAPKLKSILSDVSSSYWADHEDVKLWVIMVGFCCASTPSAESAWFVKEAFDLSRHHIALVSATSSVSDLSDLLERFQQNFFFDVPAQRTLTRDLAEKLHHGNA